MRDLVAGLAFALIVLTIFSPQKVGHVLHQVQIDFMIGWER
jgi:hypothetical protein